MILGIDMRTLNTNAEEYKKEIPEPVLFEYVYKLSAPLRIIAGFALAAFVIVPIVLLILSENLRGTLPDNFIFFFILIPIFFNLIFYKKKYIFTERGLYVIERERGKISGTGTPRLLMEWGDYDRFKKTLLGFKIFNRAKVEEYGHGDIGQGSPIDLNRMILGSGSVTIFCGGEDETQVEYFLISRNIHPSDIG
jgi:hypothetical protein